MFNPKRILVPMDFSDEAMLSWDWALMLAGLTAGTTVYPAYVFSVLPDLAAVDVGRGDFRQVTQEWVDSKMESLQEHLPKGVSCVPMFATGKPDDEIAEMCGQKGIDLVVMTTHGRTGVSHLLHGSVAESLVRKAPCPVLVLHMNRLMLEPVHKPL